jgi:hypothetical protein
MENQNNIGAPQPNPNPQAYASPPAPPEANTTHQQSFYQKDPRQKSPFRAAFLSLMPGLGQVYLGYYQQGFINIAVVACLISALASDTLGDLTPLAGFFLVFFWMYNLVDASRRATFYNNALSGIDSLSLPDDSLFQQSKGSLLGGVALVFFGGLFFLHNMFDLSLAWMEDWWPILLVLIGAYLIYGAVGDKLTKKESTTSIISSDE